MTANVSLFNSEGLAHLDSKMQGLSKAVKLPAWSLFSVAPIKYM